MSAEQQISDMELQKLKGGADVHQTKGQTPNSTLENMKEAAYSIYEQYLSEKVNSYVTEQGGSLKRKQVVALQNWECARQTLDYVTEQGVSLQRKELPYRTGR